MEEANIFNAMFNNLNAFVAFFEGDGNNTQDNRDAILKTDKLRCWYCAYVEDRKYLIKEVSNDKYLFWYCRHVQDDPEVWSRIRESAYAYWYCLYITDRKEVSQYITDEPWAGLHNDRGATPIRLWDDGITSDDFIALKPGEELKASVTDKKRKNNEIKL